MFNADDDLISMLNNENLRKKEENYLNKQGLPTLDISIDGLDESIRKIDNECQTGKEILMEMDMILSNLYSKLGIMTCSNDNYSNYQNNIINDIITKYEHKRDRIYKIFITKFNLKNDLENIKLELLKKYSIDDRLVQKTPTISSPLPFSGDCNFKYCFENSDSHFYSDKNSEYNSEHEHKCSREEAKSSCSISNINYYSKYYRYNSSSYSNIYSDDDIGNMNDLEDMKELEEERIENNKEINTYNFDDTTIEYSKHEHVEEYYNYLEEKLVSQLNTIDINSSTNYNDCNSNYCSKKHNNIGPCLPKQPLL
ncbi:hypothetical protein FG386_003352 [Cryptosporidium ryanae]|uniref:uncharacterized protein n=1 Tax=Cryptosporidium ryanae TaxID=515981 RepID=UPI00351A07A6|nr:hypothetical protein FG386_003352 [Cryptosporidium ryanae]